MQLAKVAIALRRRSPWEAIDLGFAMLRRWARPVYTAWAVGFVPFAAIALLAGWWMEKAWVALVLIWWLKPVYDRAVLHVLSRAVFGETLSARGVLASAGEWLHSGVIAALTFSRISMVRSFNLPVRQLEGQRGREGRARRALLGRRARSYAVWLTVACLHFEAVLMWSEGALLDLLLPAKAEQATGIWDLWRALMAGDDATGDLWSFRDAIAYAVVVSIVEPFYVAGGFALYLNRRTLLEGWDIEVALRRIAERGAAATKRAASAVATLPVATLPAATLPAATLLLCAALVSAGLFCAPLSPALAQETQSAPRQGQQDGHVDPHRPPQGRMEPRQTQQEARKDPRQELREVLKAREFQQYRDEMSWAWRGSPSKERSSSEFATMLRAIGYALAEVARVLLWAAAAALLAFGLWWLSKLLPRYAAGSREPYRPPPALFGLELAPETLPDDIPAAAAALAQAGRIREALSLLYRGALSDLVHRRGVELFASDTEEEALQRARPRLAAEAGAYLALLVAAWQAAAYAWREPGRAEVERLARDYGARFAPHFALAPNSAPGERA